MKKVYIHQEEKEIHSINRNKRSPEEIYQALVNRLKIIARDELSDQEAHAAARNLIGFYQVIIDYKIKKQNEVRNEQKISQDLNKPHI